MIVALNLVWHVGGVFYLSIAIHQSFPRQFFKVTNLPKFSPTTVLGYTVLHVHYYFELLHIKMIYVMLQIL